MLDENPIVATQVTPSKRESDSSMPEFTKRCAALFMEDWPAPPKCDDEDQMDDLMKIEVRKWRLQTLLAVQPFGIPSLALGSTYEKMFGTPFNLRDFGCDSLLPELADKMADIMLVQEPDETTPILFPQYPNDKILHDARLGYDFSDPNLDDDDSISSGSFQKTDSNDLILRAWLDRDLDFPDDTVMVGEPFEELCKISLATVPGSRGLYRAVIVSSASPDSVFIRLKSTEEVLERVRGLSAEIVDYFNRTKHPIDAYNVPEQFITLNFPCLFYSALEKTWTRCIIVGRSRSDQKVYVESIDFGGIYVVNKIFLYLMPRKFFGVPRLTFEISLAGLKPANGTSWSKTVGARLRCFSIPDYYLDILLMDFKKPMRTHFESIDSQDESSRDASVICKNLFEPNLTAKNANTMDSMMALSEKNRKRFSNRAAYSAIVIDRNDEDMDVYVNDILALETYAIKDPIQEEELSQIKTRLTRALDKIPRPTNPLGPILKS